MNNAELYEKSNSLQKRDAIQCLEEHGNKIKWKQFGDRILDIGCGDGGVTDILKNNYMPTCFSRIVGCDISENMVKFANEHYGDRKTEFHVLDIEGNVPEMFRETFDHVVSFNALHWIKNQEIAFKNIYKMLANNGDCLLLFMGHMPIYDVFRILSRSSKWSEWLRDVDHFVSPYHDSLEPEKEIINMLEKIGFDQIEVTCKRAEFVYDNEEKWKKAVAAINPFGIPEELFENFMEDYKEVLMDMKLMDLENNNVENNFNITFSYNPLIVYARKRTSANLVRHNRTY